MSLPTTPQLWNSNLSSSQNNHRLTIPFTITAGVVAYAGTEVPDILMEKGLAGSQAILTQTLIDALFGTTSEVVATTAFGTTAMAANDTLGFALKTNGQISKINHVEAFVDITTTGAIPGLGFGTKTALTDAGFTNPEVYVGASGNVIGRLNYTNVTATGTSGRGVIHMHCVLK